MSVRGAPPEFAANELGRGLQSRGKGARSIPADLVSANVIERLAGVGVHSLDDWRALGRKPFEIFRVTRAMVAHLDALALERR